MWKMGKVAPFYGNQEQYKSPRQCNKPTNANLPISTFLVIIDYNINVHIVLKISVDTTSGLVVIRFQSSLLNALSLHVTIMPIKYSYK